MTPGVSATGIDIGATGPLTGPAAFGYDEIAPAMSAVFDWVDAKGGIYGRKIHLTYLDDSYDPVKSAALTRTLVEHDDVFADVGSVGAPGEKAVQSFLNSRGIPQVFLASGCNCSSQRGDPDSFGWAPPYSVEGKILGYYVEHRFAGERIGYLYENDEFGQDVTKGLDMEVAAGSVVSRQSYEETALSAPLQQQMAALEKSGAQVVVMATVPAATALAMLAAASLGYEPQFVVESSGSDPATVGPLLESFANGAGDSSLAPTAPGLLNGVLTDAYLPPESQASSSWLKVERKLLEDYAPALWARSGLDAETELGVALGYTFVEALRSAGKDLTRAGLLRAIVSSASSFATPGLVPLAYSRKIHFGFEGAEVVELSAAGTPALTPTGSWVGAAQVSPPYVTSAGKGPIKVYRGATTLPPASLDSLLGGSPRSARH